VDVSLDAERSAAPSYTAARLEVDPLTERPGVRVTGEIGFGTRCSWRTALDRLMRHEETVLHMELSRVTFIDVAGVTDLALAAQSLPAGRRIVVHRPPPQMTRVLAAFWPGLDGIEVAP
jgi:anti-anti-sigma regulatory factor